MWQCQKCEYKNSNGSEKCHGNGCNEKRSYDFIKKNQKQVLDKCPKCDKETIFVFERNKMVEKEGVSLDGNRTTKTVVQKRFRCVECQSLCFQTGRSKKLSLEELEVLKNEYAIK